MALSKTLVEKLDKFLARYEELERLMADPETISNSQKYKEVGREFSDLQDPVELYRECLALQRKLAACNDLLNSESDAEMLEMAREEREDLAERLGEEEHKILEYLQPKDKNVGKSLFLEIRAGTGGDEAAIFAGDLLRMYSRYAENRGWKVENIRIQPSEMGGFKEIVVAIHGREAWSMLNRESGVHRVQRVPATESSGRIHTSAATVAVMFEPDEVEVNIEPSELRIDTFRSSSAGGQHVNKTDSAIRIIHLPTNTVVECQDERSQHQNRLKAMRLLRARIMQKMQDEQAREMAQMRKSQVGSGDRSERIRTYNYPEGRITDHRTDVKVYKLAMILEGEMGLLLEPMHKRFAELELELSSGPKAPA